MNLNQIVQSLQSSLAHDWDATQALLGQPQQHALHLIQAMGSHIERGKQLRPLLVLTIGAILGGCQRSHHLLAAVVEILHSATLLHDDVIDEAPKRHHQRSAWQEHGNKASILVGDYFFAQAFRWIAAIDDPKVITCLADATQVIVAGEVQQHQFSHSLELSASTYFGIIRAKTAELFKQACYLSSVLAQAPQHIQQACHDFGEAIGLAFQLQDDLLDYTSAVSGKTLGQDWQEGKTTYPVIIACQHQQYREALIAARQNHAPIEAVIAILEEANALTQTADQVQLYIKRAKKALAILPEHPHTHYLTDLLETMVERVY